MAITTYSELQTAIGNWMDRSDLNSRIPEFIQLFEAFANRKIRSREMEARTSFTTTGGSASIPDDFLESKNVFWTGSPVKSLEPYDSVTFELKYGDLQAGEPSAYLIEGDTMYVAPVNDTTGLKMLYYQRIPDLATNLTNWLLTKHPDAYLFGSLVESEAFTLDANAASLWKGRRDEVIDEIWRSGQFYRGTSQAIRVVGATP